ncbi:ABC transporter substrate-binding protein [Gammaproteobacteria bacterium AS21]
MQKLKIYLLTMIIGCSFSLAIAEQKPMRIVSADGSLTEIIYALNREDLLVGVDTTSSFPVQAKSLAQIGYKRDISAEGVISLEPNLLIATDDSGPDKTLNQIEAAGILVRRYSDNASLATVKEKVIGVAELLDMRPQGELLWQSIKHDVEQAQLKIDPSKQPIKVLFILSIKSGSPIVAGDDTPVTEMIRLAGGVNAVSGFNGYKAISLEALIAAQPEAILMVSDRVQHKDIEALLSNPAISQTPAGKNKHLVTMDALLMIGFGPRIGQAISTLSTAFYRK